MLFKILQYMQGYLRIRITGYSAERFLNACRYRGIRLWDMKPCGDAYEMNITIRGFRQIRPIIRKTKTKAVIVHRIGFPFFLYRYRRRKIFFAGAAMFLAVIHILSGLLWNIDIRGNLTRTDEALTEFLSTKKIRSGMKVSDVDCAEIVKDIRKEFDDIIWVSASIEGTKLIIQVKENRDSFQTSAENEAGKRTENVTENEEKSGTENLTENEEKSGTQNETDNQAVDIIADVDGTITEIITRKGIPLAEKGMAVKAGDILVSGQVPVNNDAGETIAYQYQEADADIKARTSIIYENELEVSRELKKYTKGKKWNYYIKSGNVSIGIGASKKENKNSERYSTETQIQLFPGFTLPVYVGKYTVLPYEKDSKSYTKEEIQYILTRRFKQYCEDLEKKGVEIIENDVKIYTGSQKAQAKGTLIVMKSIGEKRASELITIPEQPEDNRQSGE